MLNSIVGNTTNVVAQNNITLNPGFVVTAGSTLSFSAQIKTDYLQGIDYRYNIRGQLLSINNSTLTADTTNNDDANDLFGLEMLYNKADGGLGNTSYYNSRLSAVKWMAGNGSGVRGNQRAYLYNYDLLNRLTDANSKENTGSGWAANGAYNENGISYDDNGNIKTLKRNSEIGGVVKPIDDLNYTYAGNRLSNVTDGAGSQYTANGFKKLTGSASSTPYSYDANGNLTADLKKGITNHYNILNRIDSMRVTTGTNQYITYTYDAGGQLLRKKQYNSGALQKTTDYLGGFVYENGNLVYFASTEGRVRDSSGVFTKEYVITDQQGNSRISFEDDGTGVAKVRQENSYYPFGMVMANSLTPANNANKQLYNAGSEWQNDFNDLPDYYQTFYRNYDPTMGRFISVDPEAEAADSWTTYQYGYNSPGMFNDPLGNLAEAVWASEFDNGGDWQSAIVDGWNKDIDSMFPNKLYWKQVMHDIATGGGPTGMYEFVKMEWYNPEHTILSDKNGVDIGNRYAVWKFVIYALQPINNMPIPKGQHLTSYQEASMLLSKGHDYIGEAVYETAKFWAYGELLGLIKYTGIGGWIGRLAAPLAENFAGRFASNAAQFAGGEVKNSLVNLTEETFPQALAIGAEIVGGYSVYGNKGLVGNTFNRNVFLLEASGSKSLSNFKHF